MASASDIYAALAGTDAPAPSYFNPNPRAGAANQVTPAYLQALREWGAKQMEPSQPSPGPYGAYTKWNAVSDALRGAIGGYSQYRAGQMELAQRAAGAQSISQAFSPFLNQQPAAPSLTSPSGVPPQADATAAGTAPSYAGLSLSPQDRDLAARTIIGEVGPNASPQEMASVAAVIANRAASGKYGPSVGAVTQAPWQFEPWMTRRGELAAIDPNSPGYQKATAALEGVISGAVPNPVGNATHFYSPTSQAALGRQPPSWAQQYQPAGQVGGHLFYTDPNTAPQAAPVRTAALNLPGTATDAGLPDRPTVVPAQTFSPNGQQTGGPGMPAAGGMAPQPGAPAAGGTPGPAAGGMPAPAPMPAQAGPAAGAPAPGAPSATGLPHTLTAPSGLDPQRFAAIMSNPWIPDTEKAAIQQMALSRVEPKTVPTVGGQLQYNLTGQQAFIPEPKFGTVKMGGNEVPVVSTYDPRSGQWDHKVMMSGAGTPGAGGTQQATGFGVNQPDLTSPGGLLKTEIDQAAAKGYATESGKSYAKRMDTYQEASLTAQNELPQLQMLKQVLNDPKFYSGFAEGKVEMMDSALRGMGFNSGERSSLMQLAEKLGSAGTLADLKSMTGLGQLRNPEIDLLRQSNFSPENNPAANRAVVEIRSRLAQRQVEVAGMASRYAEANNGMIDRNFDKQVREYYQNKPLLSDEELRGYKTLLSNKGGQNLFPSSAPGTAQPGQAPARVMNEADYNAIPSGDTYTGPDGQIRRKR